MNQLISNGGDCRTAPATPGLLIIYEPVYRTALATLGLLKTLDPRASEPLYLVKSADFKDVSLAQ